MAPVRYGPLPRDTVRRLQAMLGALGDVDRAAISSNELAQIVGSTSTTVRSDLGYLRVSGTRGVGYNTDALRLAIGRALRSDLSVPVVIIGAGRFGSALADHLTITGTASVLAVADANPSVIGTRIGGVEVVDVALLAPSEQFVGVIATPRESAQEAADLLDGLGARGIYNLTAASITAECEVQSLDLAGELRLLLLRGLLLVR